MKSFRASFLLAGVAAVCASGQTPDFNTGQAARLIVGQKNFTYSDFGATNQLIGSPSGLAYANGTLWVVDSTRLGSSPNNNRVLRFSDAGSFPKPTDPPDVPGSTCAACRGSASLVIGQPDFITTNQNLSQNGLRRPTGVATDGTVLAVADTDNNRVLIWLSMPKSNNQPADVVVGQTDFTHNRTSVPPTQTSLRGPSGVWIAGGKLFIADSQDNRILIYNRIPTSNNAPADVVVGQANFTAFVQPDLTAAQPNTAANNMQTPVSVTTDGTRLFVSDLGQNRVLIWNSIPTQNGTPADIALGQPDLTSAVENNSAKTVSSTFTDLTGVLCDSNGATSDNKPTFPARCAATLSFPRFALSDGKRLFVADGGNDRVLVYNTIPTKSGARADIVIGQPDEFSDNAGQNPDGTNAFQTPAALAWDGTNLYVSDTFNRRVLIFSPGLRNIPLDGVRNAASQEIYAIGTISLGGTITEKDTVTVKIADKDYPYTVVKGDTVEKVLQNIVALIDKGPDPNVTATPNVSTLQIVLTARKPGQAGVVDYSVTASTNATLAVAAGAASLNIYLENPSQIAPNTIVAVNGTNLCDSAAAADFSGDYLPFALNGCRLYIDGVAAPLLYVSPTQINAQMPNEATDRTSVSIFVRTEHADGTVTSSTPVAATIVTQNPGIFALPGNDPRPGVVYHGSSNAFDLVGVDGNIQESDVASLKIGQDTAFDANGDGIVDENEGVTATEYKYTVQKGDTLATVRDALIAAINSASNPVVTASVANEYFRIALKAIQPGLAGEGIKVVANVSTDTTKNSGGPALLLTAYNPTLCCSNTEGALVTTDNPAVPGELLYVFATGLGVTEPQNQETGRIFRGGTQDPPAVVVDSILAGGTTANVVNVGLLKGTVGVYYVQFQLSTGATANTLTPLTIAQQAFVSNVVTFPVQSPGQPVSFRVTPAATVVKKGDALNFTVTGVDFRGNDATLYTGTVQVTSNDGSAALPSNLALTNGTATFSVTFNTEGTFTVTVNDTALSNIVGTSREIVVNSTGVAPTSARPLPQRRLRPHR